MELGLTLGHPSKPQLTNTITPLNFPLPFNNIISSAKHHHHEDHHQSQDFRNHQRVSLELHLLPHTSPSHTGSWEGGSSENTGLPAAAVEEGVAVTSSPNTNSGATSFLVDCSVYRRNGSGRKREAGGGVMGNDVVDEAERGSDEDENGVSRKKLRLSKQQSAYLEESFKEHNTLTPKQKIALAKQLNLRPRQVEVWFQNRRARTKLKQTEVDCEYLKRCCETLTEENRRLNKEVQELRALKTSNPYYMQLPATTLTMCPSCERVATATAAATAATNPASKTTATSLTKPHFYPFSHSQTNPHKSAAS